ncbi:hypothetical protein IMCC21906_00143 [Spongiibacter sp. IMCC21906]|nr:hypothetical protein IMCC21906_00143 [Spongiibacter sp. IMCC21906]
MNYAPIQPKPIAVGARSYQTGTLYHITTQWGEPVGGRAEADELRSNPPQTPSRSAKVNCVAREGNLGWPAPSRGDTVLLYHRGRRPLLPNWYVVSHHDTMG